MRDIDIIACATFATSQGVVKVWEKKNMQFLKKVTFFAKVVQDSMQIWLKLDRIKKSIYWILNALTLILSGLQDKDWIVLKEPTQYYKKQSYLEAFMVAVVAAAIFFSKSYSNTAELREEFKSFFRYFFSLPTFISNCQGQKFVY